MLLTSLSSSKSQYLLWLLRYVHLTCSVWNLGPLFAAVTEKNGSITVAAGSNCITTTNNHHHNSLAFSYFPTSLADHVFDPTLAQVQKNPLLSHTARCARSVVGHAHCLDVGMVHPGPSHLLVYGRNRPKPSVHQ